MKFNIKLILLGGVVYYLAQWIVGALTGPLIHEGVLEPAYQATAGFWRPELMQDPPDMGALFPYWITTGLIAAFIGVFIFDNVRAALSGSAWVKGLKFGLLMALLQSAFIAGWSGVFNLPLNIWLWWGLEGFVFFLFSGAVLGWFAGRFAPD